MSVHTDAELFRRGADTAVASWEEYARGAVGAFVQRFPGVAVAVFPNEPERAVYNNALLTRDLMAAERAAGIDAMEAAYAGPASRASLPGFTRVTRQCAEISNSVATQSTRRRVRWRCPSMTSACPGLT